MPSHRLKLTVVNLAGPDDPALWRVSEREYIRWLGVHGARVTRIKHDN